MVLPPISRWKVVAGGVVVLVVVTGAVITLWWAATRGLTGKDLVTARLDALKVGLSLGVGSGGLFALYLTWRRQRATEAELDNRERALLHQLEVAGNANTDATERRVTELYSKAVEQLGSDKAPVRLGGLYALERLAQNNSEHRQTVVNVLCAYLRMPYRSPGAPPSDDEDRHRHDEYRDQVQEREVRLAAQRILAHHLAPRDADRFWDGIDLDLTGANLVDFDLRACRLGPARFTSATFTGLARFDEVTLTGSISFDGATFTDDARFDGVNFSSLISFERATGLGGVVPMSSQLDLAELLELGDPYEFDPAAAWVPRLNRDRLRIKFGIRADGTPVEVDLKESAQDGMGPHGLLVGMAGSGKSELLRTLVLGLAVTHSPSSLNFLLIDFKGEGTFTRLDALPHTGAVITNLAGEPHLIARMADTINGELTRRQEQLRTAGNFSSVRDYERARSAGASLPEMPSLLVICDEFAELLSVKPDFIDMFVQIGRVGRSLGVHLLLATRRLDEGRLRGLESHLSYWISLRTSTETRSKMVLGMTDAFRLPRAPGHGLLKVGNDPMQRFRSAHVSAVHQRHKDETRTEELEQNEEKVLGETLLEIVVGRLQGVGAPARQLWLQPLDESPALGELLPAPIIDPQRGLTAGSAELPGALRPVLGIVDRPVELRRDLLTLDLSGGTGHVLVLGAPQTGKSTALCTLIASLALTHTPREVQFYCLDFGGGTLSSIEGLPHVAGVSGRWDAGAVRRTVAEVAMVLEQRERVFAEHQIDGIAAYRKARHEGQFAEQPHGDVFLVVDGWQTLRSDFAELGEVVSDMAARGLSYGVHLVATCAQALELQANVRDLFTSKLELKIDDSNESIIDGRAASNVPADAPGRGISMSAHQMLVALPRVDVGDTTEGLAESVSGLVSAIGSAWQGPSAPSVRLLPDMLPYEALPPNDALAGAEAGLAIGLYERDLSPLRLDFATDPHFFVLADTECGKTSFLRALARRIENAYSSTEARIVVVDYRRGLVGEISEKYLLGSGDNDAHSRDLLAEVAVAVTKRLPGRDVTAEQLRSRSWWVGPEVFVLVDDYDMVATHKEHPLMPLWPLLAHGSDIGLHVVVTRRSSGAVHGLNEPILARLREIGTPGLMLSGDRDEGPLLGGMHAQVLPPGSGWLVDRRGQRDLVQLAWLPPKE